MNIKIFKILTLLSVISFPIAVNAEWKASISNDEMTYEKIGTVISSSTKGSNWLGKPYSAVIRCKSSNYLELDVYINWGEFITNHASDFIQFRFDTDTMFKVEANPSADGSSSFVKNEKNISNVINLMKQKNVMRVKTTDFRHVSTQVGKFSLSGFTPAFNNACGWWSLENEKINSKYESVDPYVAEALKRWGPKNITINKKILKSLGDYSGPINADIDNNFAQKVASAYYRYLEKCKNGSVSGTICDTYKMMQKGGRSNYQPPVSVVFYELSSGALKAEAGKLGVGD